MRDVVRLAQPHVGIAKGKSQETKSSLKGSWTAANSSLRYLHGYQEIGPIPKKSESSPKLSCEIRNFGGSIAPDN